ncbi:hypothetical protein AWW66_29770 [Micromonospora rosaria]|uniref:DUF202 domain-containing protein n=1 Tax=Micromonospora rosaria TaxID=47874 RepID=A0A136PJ56_9ACTN|nr:DUF202 domain-containing protein [Micromonospora rosaria]KXK58446.1 hypothetical protein AWW66_29770 [Micromonospora rosaria]
MTGTPPGRDPGLQPERTRLAWRRTALALTVVAVLALRLALAGEPFGALVGLAVVGVWAVALRVCWRRGTGSGPAPTGGPALAQAALTAVGLALAGLALVLHELW